MTMNGEPLRRQLRPAAVWHTILALGALGGALAPAGAAAQGMHGEPQVSYSATQAAAGRQLYGAQCGMCHGMRLEGAAGPALTGRSFGTTWMSGTRTVRSLVDLIATTMPTNHPGSLKPAQVMALVAYLFEQNGVPAGTAPLAGASLEAVIPRGSATAAATPVHHAPLHLPEGPAEVGHASGTLPADADLLHVPAGDWLTFNRDYAGDRFSPLAQIDTHNAAMLQPVCIRQLGEIGSFETSPLVRDGTIYLTTPHETFAVDGRTCAIRWSHHYVPVDPEHIPGNRGAALYRGKVYRGTTDGYLLALDAATGMLLWKAHVADAYEGAFVSGAPLAFDGRLFIGEGGADHGIRGRFYAFDAETGKPLWTFDIVPGPEAAPRQTWGSGIPRGGSSWSSVALDPEHRLLFVPTGNPGPDFEGAGRPGANLYTDSVLALELDTGKLRWYVQQVPHDVHDWDTAAAPAIYDRSGRHYMAVASKDGFLYRYDRDSHAQVSQTQTTTRRNVDVPFTPAAPVTYCPGGLGQWNGPAYAAKSGLLFVGSADRCDTILGIAKPPPFSPGTMDFGARLMTNPQSPSSGWVRAIDADTGRQRWAYHAPTPIVAAMTPTAGGLLLTGDLDGDFLVFDAATGKVLYRFMTGGGIAGGITTYEAGGREYIAVPSGSSSRGTWGSTGSATLILFALP